MTVREAAEILGVSRERVANLIRQGRITVTGSETFRGFDTRVLVSREDVLRYSRERRPPGRPRKAQEIA